MCTLRGRALYPAPGTPSQQILGQESVFSRVNRSNEYILAVDIPNAPRRTPCDQHKLLSLLLGHCGYCQVLSGSLVHHRHFGFVKLALELGPHASVVLAPLDSHYHVPLTSLLLSDSSDIGADDPMGVSRSYGALSSAGPSSNVSFWSRISSPTLTASIVIGRQSIEDDSIDP